MNPTKIIAAEYTATTFVAAEVVSTDWFNAAKKEPGQPGVFEVNAVEEFDNDPSCRRFAFFNGKTYGPIANTPASAFDLRFGKSSLGHTISAFRGLSEQA